jgi:lipopolysaccharide/colanic/teichoic acid biosynthesis glycosyltransferase
MTDLITRQQANAIAEVIAAHRSEIPWLHLSGQRFLKRLLDLTVALLLILVLSPVMVIVAFLVRLTSKGPVFFIQTRIGLNGTPLRMYKFRSMTAELPDGSAKGIGEVTGSDARLTPIGGWIRAWRLDELPQLFQVLSGSMSLVGPRPDLPINLDLYTREQMLRFAMLPGCTASTFTRGAFQNEWSVRRDIDVEYVKQWSFWLDVKVLFGSFIVLILQKDTVPESNAHSQFYKPGQEEGTAK